MNHAAAARPDADLIRALEGAHYHPLWDRYKRITPIAPATPRRADALALARLRTARGPCGEGGADRGRRAARDHLRQPRVRRRNGHHVESDRRVHDSRARRPRGAAPAHRGGDPVRDARRGRGDDRERPALRDEAGRPRADAADVLARARQRIGPPHLLVRRRQHAADLRARGELLRARPARRRRTSGTWARATRGNTAIRRGDAAQARRASGGRRTARGCCATRTPRRPGDADARLLRRAAREGRARRARRGRPGTRSCWSSPARAARRSATSASSGRGTTSSPSRTGPGRATRHAAPTPISFS